ncbi:hypothetical protein ACQPZJ_12635 [Actinoplanes sp. CA-054009]
MVKYLLVAAAVYLGAIGVALLVTPAQFGVDAVPRDASTELISLLRLLGGPFLGIAVLNWLLRGTSSPDAVQAILWGNLVGFGVVAVNDLLGVLTGDARDLARVFLVVHLAFGAAFAVALARTRSNASARHP